MLPAAIIVFREILEISLIISIIAASTLGIKNSRKMISLGILIGAVGSGIFAVGIHKLNNLIADIGQEIFNIIILSITILFLSWTLFWMSKHSKKLSSKFKDLGGKVATGTYPIKAIALVIAFTMLREGSEISLFLYSLKVAGNSLNEIIGGGLIGLLLGSSVGMILYFGLIKLKSRILFKITSLLLILLISSLSVELASNLQAANIITVLQDPLWNSSHILSQNSVLGKSLHVLVGYTAKPNGLQLLFYVVTFTVLISNNILQNYRAKKL